MTGDELKNWRMRLGMTQGDLAKRLDISAQTISNYERGANVPRVVSMAIRYLLTTRAPA